MSDRPLPPMEQIEDEVTVLARIAQAAGDTRAANAFNRAAEQLACGVRPVLSGGDLLIPSRQTAGTVYQVTGLGCSCTAGINGRHCWHAALAEAVVNVWERQGADDDGDDGPDYSDADRMQALAEPMYV